MTIDEERVRDKVEQKSSCGDIEVGFFSENPICLRKFILDAFVYFKPV